MRTFTFILATAVLVQFAAFTTSVQAQNFGAMGTQWFYSSHAEGGCPGNCEYIHFESVLDTVINGQAVNKIAPIYYRYVGDTMHLGPIYLYEQSDTVFMWNFERERFLTTYIFNGEVGDTLVLDAPEYVEWTDTIYRLVITDITEVILDGVTLKKYGTSALDDFQFYNGGFFMDRIGGLDYFFPRAIIFPEASGPIRCYSDANIDTSFQSVACDYILPVSIDELTEDEGITVHPNPASATLHISSTRPVERIELYDMLGKQVMATDNTTIDLTGQPEGLYVVAILLTNGQRVERRVVRQTN